MMENGFAAARYPSFPADRGGYESYYLKAGSPDREQAIWIRNTVHQQPGGRPTGSLWFVLFERGATRPYAVKQTFTDLAAPGEGNALLSIGEAAFGRGEIYGAAQGEGRSAQWQLTLGGEAEPLLHLPRKLYTASLPKTKTLTLLPEAVFNGQVRIADRAIDLQDWSGMVGHNWGSQHAEQWVWLHGDGLEEGAGEAPGGADAPWIDLVAGRVRVGFATTPWIANGALMIDGKRIQLGGIGKTVSTHVNARLGRCEIALRGDGVRARAVFEAPRDQIVAWRYADPDGSEHHSLNSSLADLELIVERKHRGPVTLRTKRRAVYEWGTRYTAHGIPVEPFADG